MCVASNLFLFAPLGAVTDVDSELVDHRQGRQRDIELEAFEGPKRVDRQEGRRVVPT